MNNEETSKSWVQPVLARHLGQTTAPAGLWERVSQPRAAKPVVSNSRLIWAFAAVLVAAVLLWGFHLRGEAPASNQTLAFRSDRPDQVQAWVEANTGLEVPLHATASARLIGASLVKGPVPAAKIVFRTGANDVSLLVASLDTPAPERNGDHGFSWTVRGQRYTLACVDAEELRIGCLLCHAGA